MLTLSTRRSQPFIHCLGLHSKCYRQFSFEAGDIPGFQFKVNQKVRDEHANDVDNIEVPVEEVKKKRGRPRKTIDRPVEVKLKKKRGRPKKIMDVTVEDKPEKVAWKSRSFKDPMEEAIAQTAAREGSLTKETEINHLEEESQSPTLTTWFRRKAKTLEEIEAENPHYKPLEGAFRDLVKASHYPVLPRPENPDATREPGRARPKDTRPLERFQGPSGKLLSKLRYGYSKIQPRMEIDSESEKISKHIAKFYNAARGRNSSTRGKVNPNRLHVVSKSLCADIIERMKPTLEKHRGCDIIDINPGAGVFSSALHEALQPRTHILMEPEAEVYKPLLQPLLDAEGSTYKFIAKSGLVFRNQYDILNPQFFPHQVELPENDPRLHEPNNTLLCVLNMALFPKTAFRGFASITSLIQWQFLAAARSQGLFHKYGNVRILMWVADGEKENLVCKEVYSRRRGEIESAEVAESVEEVASSTIDQRSQVREHALDLQSSLDTLKRMRANGITTPLHRQGPMEQQAIQEAMAPDRTHKVFKRSMDYYRYLEMEEKFAAGEFNMYSIPLETIMEKWYLMDIGSKFETKEYARMVKLKNLKATKRFMEGVNFKKTGFHPKLTELNDLTRRFEEGQFPQYNTPDGTIPKRAKKNVSCYYTKEYAELVAIRTRLREQIKRNRIFEDILDQHDEIAEDQKKLYLLDQSSPEAIALQSNISSKEAAIEAATQNLSSGRADMLRSMLDNRRAFASKLFFWDRRKAEPLKVYPEECFPQQEMALMDFTPRPLDPVFRANYPANYNIFEYIIAEVSFLATSSVEQALAALAPGALEYLKAECPSLTNPLVGGSPDLSKMNCRLLTREMFIEIVEAWTRWIWAPTRFEMMAKLKGEDAEYDEDPERGYRMH